MPCELANPVRLDRDDAVREYDREAARRFWEVLRRCDGALRELAGAWVGKQSPVQFFWGSFDLASTRFSGRRAPEQPGLDPVTQEAYSHEVISFGFWPGGVTQTGVEVAEPIVYAYARGSATRGCGRPRRGGTIASASSSCPTSGSARAAIPAPSSAPSARTSTPRARPSADGIARRSSGDRRPRRIVRRRRARTPTRRRRLSRARRRGPRAAPGRPRGSDPPRRRAAGAPALRTGPAA
jgi:hypothetical protein